MLVATGLVPNEVLSVRRLLLLARCLLLLHLRCPLLRLCLPQAPLAIPSSSLRLCPILPSEPVLLQGGDRNQSLDGRGG